jgi:hypothetical protein
MELSLRHEGHCESLPATIVDDIFAQWGSVGMTNPMGAVWEGQNTSIWA